MHQAGVASAASVLAAAPSKAPFYVAGGILVAWAALLALTGITHVDFPGSESRARLVMLTTVLLVAATITTAVVTAGEEEGATAEPSGPPGEVTSLRLRADPSGQLAYDKKQATITAGNVAIELVNTSPVSHDVTIAQGTRIVAQTKTIQDATASVRANLRAGDYVFYCSVDGHRQAGMQGKLTAQ